MNCTNQISKEGIPEGEEIPIKGNMTSKPLVVEETIIGGLVETNQLLTNVHKLIKPST